MTVQAAETRIRPVAHPFTAREIARRADSAGYRHGVAAGHEDAIAHLRQLISDTWHDLNAERRLRDHCHREDPARFAWDRCAVVRAGVLRQLFAIRRALKEGAQP